MAYHTFVYLFLFLPAVVAVYYILPLRFRPLVLLAASYLFYYLSAGIRILYLLGATGLIYTAGLGIGRIRDRFAQVSRTMPRDQKKQQKKAAKRKEKTVLAAAVFLLVGALFLLKYFNFFSLNVNRVLCRLPIQGQLPYVSFIAPLGISFFALQAIGYLVDVYRGKYPADRNIVRLALFLSFFPQIIEGPICRYDQTAEKLYEGHAFSYTNFTLGLQRIVWGLFKKMVIADRLDVLVGEVFTNYANYSGEILAVAALGYTIQLYADFSGSMDMVLGSAQMFSVELPENFTRPFFAGSIAEFWRRWHITLGTWFKDYIFYPISLAPFFQKIRKRHRGYGGKLLLSACALGAVWFCNGLWHGAGWHYLFYGFYHFTLIFSGLAMEPVFERMTSALHIDRKSRGYQAFRVFRTFCLVVLGELFFRAESLRSGFAMARGIFTRFQIGGLTDGTLLTLGLDAMDLWILLTAVVVLLIVSLIQERGVRIREAIGRFSLVRRWGIYYALIFAVILFGAYGEGYRLVDLLYASF
jgi:alginate O-acetyltransferase complex protein AlgI